MIVEDNIVLRRSIRLLTHSEKRRGYIFITKDVQLSDRYSNGVHIFFNEMYYGLKQLDKSGRIHLKIVVEIIGDKKYETELSSKYVIIKTIGIY